MTEMIQLDVESAMQRYHAALGDAIDQMYHDWDEELKDIIALAERRKASNFPKIGSGSGSEFDHAMQIANYANKTIHKPVVSVYNTSAISMTIVHRLFGLFLDEGMRIISLARSVFGGEVCGMNRYMMSGGADKIKRVMCYTMPIHVVKQSYFTPDFKQYASDKCTFDWGHVLMFNDPDFRFVLKGFCDYHEAFPEIHAIANSAMNTTCHRAHDRNDPVSELMARV